ncbi:hypothetical protein [Streptomyces sp. WMMC940]|uniref:hypothetical protein n=1 Tax=Streptomyces sp. WMMC940 TaxID=3015153 RepID=UPI002FC27CE4
MPRTSSIRVRKEGGTKIVRPSGWVTASVTPGGTLPVTFTARSCGRATDSVTQSATRSSTRDSRTTATARRSFGLIVSSS